MLDDDDDAVDEVRLRLWTYHSLSGENEYRESLWNDINRGKLIRPSELSGNPNNRVN
jgi:hypothetical protein